VKEAEREEQPFESHSLLRRVEEIGIAYWILPRYLKNESLRINLLSPWDERSGKLPLPGEKTARYSRAVLWEARSSSSHRSAGR